MAISTIAGAISGLQYPIRTYSKLSGAWNNDMVSFWAVGGWPQAGSFDTTLNGVALSGTGGNITGQIPFVDAASGNVYLSRFSGSMTFGSTNTAAGGSLILADRLWHNGGIGITTTTAQNITSPTWPARDSAGSTNGDGVMIGLETSAFTGGPAGAQTITVSYTNSAGTAGRTGANIDVTRSGGFQAGEFYPIGLQSGDKGVKSVESVTLTSSGVSGTVNLVAYREVAQIELNGNHYPNAHDPLTCGFPILYPGSVLFLIWRSRGGSNTTVSVVGTIQFAAG